MCVSVAAAIYVKSPFQIGFLGRILKLTQSVSLQNDMLHTSHYSALCKISHLKIFRDEPQVGLFYPRLSFGTVLPNGVKVTV